MRKEGPRRLLKTTHLDLRGDRSSPRELRYSLMDDNEEDIDSCARVMLGFHEYRMMSSAYCRIWVSECNREEILLTREVRQPGNSENSETLCACKVVHP